MKTVIKIIFLSLLVFNSSVFAQEAEKITEFGNLNCELYLGQMDNFLIAARNFPNSKVYIFVYEGKEQVFNNKSGQFKLLNPAFGTAKAKIRSMKKYMGYRKVSTDNFIFIAGGFREELSVEFWLVPSGAKVPQLNPTLTKMKYRKGKPRGFCIGCC